MPMDRNKYPDNWKEISFHIRTIFVTDESTSGSARSKLGKRRCFEMSSTNLIYHVGLSGGKDSAAALLWMVYESGIPHTQIVASFCNTVNEAECTYQHLLLLSRQVFPIVWLETEGFLNLAHRKGRFPSTKARFCTQELKLLPTKRFLDLLSEYGEVVSVSGVRRDESPERSRLAEWGNPLESYFGLREWRPLIHWTLDDVLAIHRRYGIPLNPLYAKGARRVGCFPCINSSKTELRAVAQFFPDRVNQLRDWEHSFDNANGISTFFPPKMVPPRFRTGQVTTKDNCTVAVATIDDVIQWAKTGWRAKGLGWDVDGLFDAMDDGNAPVCLSQSLACE